MRIQITCETTLAFEITIDDQPTAILMMRDGEWRLCRDGDFGTFITRGSTRWLTALRKAIELLAPEQSEVGS